MHLALNILLAATLKVQDIPKGVNYKKCSDVTNSIAERKLKTMLSQKFEKADYTPVTSKALIIGPTLWAAMKPAVGKSFDSAKPVVYLVPYGKEKKQVQRLEGKLAKTADQLETTWIVVFSMVDRAGGNFTIRKANANELSYYWAIIAYDIEEPLYIIVCGKQKFLCHFDDKAKDPRVFFIDLVPN